MEAARRQRDASSAPAPRAGPASGPAAGARATTWSRRARSGGWRRSPSSPRRCCARAARWSRGRAGATARGGRARRRRGRGSRCGPGGPRVVPYAAGSQHRHLHWSKSGPTPAAAAPPGDGEEASRSGTRRRLAPRPDASRSRADGIVYAIANQKGGVGKTTTAVNVAACVAAAGRQVLLVDLDPQCNATVALGLDRDGRPSSYECLCGETSVAVAARPAGPDNLWIVPANRDLAGAAVELPRIDGLRAPPARRARTGARALRADPARLPALARPGHRQRPRRRRPGHRPGPGRVPGARGTGPVPRDPGSRSGASSTRRWF